MKVLAQSLASNSELVLISKYIVGVNMHLLPGV